MFMENKVAIVDKVWADQISLFIFQIVAHIGLIWGIFNFHWYEWFVVLFVYFLTGCLGVSITYHRLLSHAAFESKYAWWEKVGTGLAAWGLVGSSIGWVNTHKNHHRYVDKEGDPHSPGVLGFMKVQWFSMFLTPKNLRLVVRMVRDEFHQKIHKGYFLTHYLVFVFLWAFFGWHITALVYLAPAAVLWNAGSLINTWGHTKFLTYRNHDTPDSSQNNYLLGYTVWGEGWHNNHHNKASKSYFGEKPWEFDLSGWIIDKFLRK